ncbi:MAG TPA: translation initiation factor IF-3 [Armatimonadota bacterium]|nr:translation initiation factor IF-3 [Armatimonadota bacterium]
MHINKELRVNERIRARECRLIDETGAQLGIVNVREALSLARGKGLDLIEVAPTAAPPVCKIMDYGKFKYEQGKREREARKKQHVSEMKGIKMRPAIDEHDFQFKLKHIQRFLQEGDKVKVTIIFRSREITHPEFARRSLDRLAEGTSEMAVVEKPPSMEGRTLTMILSPK